MNLIISLKKKVCGCSLKALAIKNHKSICTITVCWLIQWHMCVCVCAGADEFNSSRQELDVLSSGHHVTQLFRMKTWSRLKGTVNQPPLMEDVFTECPVTSLPTDVLFNTCRCIEKSSPSFISHLYLSFSL